MTPRPDPWQELGEFIREQRASARLSLRRLADLAGVSNPYLSQIERGLRRPSAEILQQIARGLRISAETLYVRAGILEDRQVGTDLTHAILAEPTLTAEQKQALLRVFRSFQRENEPAGDDPADGGGAPGAGVGPANDGGAPGPEAGPQGPEAGAPGREAGAPSAAPSGSPSPL